jgi:hypothetical protein
MCSKESLSLPWNTEVAGSISLRNYLSSHRETMC